MRVLYLSQYFPPEVGATQTRAYEMATGLIQAGHEVTMLTEVPNHPQGIIRPEYQGRLWTRERLDDIDVIRVWVKTSPIKTTRRRLAFYLSYMVNATLAGLVLTHGPYDLLYATSPPLFVGGAGLALSFLYRIPMVFEIRDLWPESAVVLGELKNARLIRWATWLEETCYSHAKKIIVTAQEMAEHLESRGQNSARIAVVRNGANPELFRFDRCARQRLRQELGLADAFVVVYAGLLGIAQGLDTSLEAAAQLTRQRPPVHFLYIGDGPVKTMLQSRARDLNLPNTTFLPSRPREDIPRYLSAADVAMVPLTRRRLLGALPSKMFDAMACGRPVILAAEGEACQILSEADAGIIIPPGDSASLVQAILRLRATPDLRQRYGQKGRHAVQTRYSRQAQARRLVELLETLEIAGLPQ